VSLPLAIATLRALSRAHTPVDPMKPTTALVTEGPFRYSRNPIYLALTLLYLGVAFLVNALWIPAIPAAGPIASDVRFKKRVVGSLAIHFALIPVFPQSEKARCLLEKDTKS